MRCDVLRHQRASGTAIYRKTLRGGTNLRETPIRYCPTSASTSLNPSVPDGGEHGTEEALGTMRGGAQRLDRPEPVTLILTIFVGFSSRKGRGQVGAAWVINPAHSFPSIYPKRHDR